MPLPSYPSITFKHLITTTLLFKGLTTYKLLLYGTGILVFDIQAMALMRINLDTTDQHKPGDWIKVSEGTTLQLEYSSSQQSSKSPQNSFPSAEWEYDLSQQEDQFVVSNGRIRVGTLFLLAQPIRC